VAIIGGALAGAATATLLLREQPGLRVLLLEKSTAFTRRVGEATVEISAWFLSRALGLTQYLNEAHLVKQGMRFWFANDQTRSLSDASEIGGLYLSRVPAWQVDRSTLDEEALHRAVALGAVLRRAAAVQRVELHPGGDQLLTVRQGERTETLRARWVVDASGCAALLARQEGWLRPNTAHSTAAAWARWRGVKDWDGLELARRHPEWAAACRGVRGTATNHFVGPGWWAWCIPLKGGDVSVGVVFDQRLVHWPEEGTLAGRLKTFLCRHPVAREILADAEAIDGDVHWRRNLAYSTTTQAGDGFVLAGDAAAFLDPFYSPGMDWLAFTATAAADLILAQKRGEDIASRVAAHNRRFTQSAERWFEAVYRDKYAFLGDYELMRVAFLLDLGLYYLGVASQPYKRGLDGLRQPVFSNAPSIPIYHLMRTYTRRLAAMARARQARGTWGRHNAGRRFLFGGYTFSPASTRPILKALLAWGRLELTEGWRSWFASPALRQPSSGHAPPTTAQPQSVPCPATARNA
jgi:flavin-dependent dehydrogenase